MSDTTDVSDFLYQLTEPAPAPASFAVDFLPLWTMQLPAPRPPRESSK